MSYLIQRVLTHALWSVPGMTPEVARDALFCALSETSILSVYRRERVSARECRSVKKAIHKLIAESRM